MHRMHNRNVHFRHPSTWRNVFKHSSSKAGNYSPDSATKNRYGADYAPLYNPDSYNAYHGADFNSNFPAYRSETEYSGRDEFSTTPYHYVDMNNTSAAPDRLNESFYEGCSNQTEAKVKHDAGIQETGLQGVKVLEPGMTVESSNTLSTTMDSLPRSRSPAQRSAQDLAPQFVSHGLPNLGNTCYMNSVLQCLFNIEKFRNFFIQGGHLMGKPQIPLTESFVELLSSAFTKNITNGDLTLPITQFKDTLEKLSPVFQGYSQNDAHEFFRVLIEKIHDEQNSGLKRFASYEEFQPSRRTMTIYQLAEDWKKYSDSRDKSLITSVFGGVLLNEVSCGNCRHVSYTFEDALDLPLNLSNTQQASSSQYKVATTLYDCLKRFTTPEPVEGYECEGCQRKNTSVKRTTMWKQPEVLVVQFKRFVSDNYGNRRALKERISFPTGTMTLDYFTHEKSNEPRGKFQLQAIVNHYGDLNGGHYIAYLYNDQLRCWLKYNDSQVTKVDQREVDEFGQASVEPYILFYKRI